MTSVNTAHRAIFLDAVYLRETEIRKAMVSRVARLNHAYLKDFDWKTTVSSHKTGDPESKCSAKYSQISEKL
jgi:hypothetical protein